MVPLTAIGSRLEATTATHSVQGAAAQQQAAQNEISEFVHIKQRLDAYAAAHGFSSSVKTTIEPQGLVIRVLTDDLLFASGQAALTAVPTLCSTRSPSC